MDGGPKSIKKPRVQLVDFIATDCGILIECYDNDPEFFQIPNWVRNRIKDEGRKLNFAAIDDVAQKFTEDDAGRDFTTKLVNGEATIQVCSYFTGNITKLYRRKQNNL